MLMNVTQTAEHLGIPARQVYYYCSKGLIPHIRIGRLVRFSEDQIKRWIEAGGSSLPDGRNGAQQGGNDGNVI